MPAHRNAKAPETVVSEAFTINAIVERFYPGDGLGGFSETAVALHPVERSLKRSPDESCRIFTMRLDAPVDSDRPPGHIKLSTPLRSTRRSPGRMTVKRADSIRTLHARSESTCWKCTTFLDKVKAKEPVK